MSKKQDFEPEAVRVAEQLRSEIIDGVRLPGSKLIEREVAVELGVSRLPVREALKTLISEGLVTQRPRSWAVVREFKASDIADVIEVRVALELMTFKLAAQRYTRTSLDELRAVLDEELDSARRGDALTSRRAGTKFHDLVNVMAGNELLCELHRSLGGRMRWLMAQHDDLMEMALEHERLYEAIAARDVAVMDELIPEHLETSRASANARQRKVATGAF
ncbi:GntR family transcriptional regulator [Glutamicibacter sp.]|uniref:GntR family transcriptional regulator n=1 Tax=Glutamicibacter sp. TaxID=1931995 RepID=UPI0028BD49CD|nr:GntR family transcriptional regulator [Glutamicibacter sp.]